MLDKFGVEPSEIGKKKAAVEDFDAPTERMNPEEQPTGLPHQDELQPRRPRDTGTGTPARRGIRAQNHRRRI